MVVSEQTAKTVNIYNHQRPSRPIPAAAAHRQPPHHHQSAAATQEYLSWEGLMPLRGGCLPQKLDEKLLRADWQVQFRVLNDLQRLAKFHPEVLLARAGSCQQQNQNIGPNSPCSAGQRGSPLKPTNPHYQHGDLLLLDAIEFACNLTQSLRSNVTKNAFQCINFILRSLQDKALCALASSARGLDLLKKLVLCLCTRSSSSDKKFISETAEEARTTLIGLEKAVSTVVPALAENMAAKQSNIHTLIRLAETEVEILEQAASFSSSSSAVVGRVYRAISSSVAILSGVRTPQAKLLTKKLIGAFKHYNLPAGMSWQGFSSDCCNKASSESAKKQLLEIMGGGHTTITGGGSINYPQIQNRSLASNSARPLPRRPVLMTQPKQRRRSASLVAVPPPPTQNRVLLGESCPTSSNNNFGGGKQGMRPESLPCGNNAAAVPGPSSLGGGLLTSRGRLIQPIQRQRSASLPREAKEDPRELLFIPDLTD